MFKKLIRIILSLFVIPLCVMPVQAQEGGDDIEIPALIRGYIWDGANLLSKASEEYITKKDLDLDKHCGGYIEIVTTTNIEYDVEDYANEIFENWEIGNPETKNGVLLVVIPASKEYYLCYGEDIEDKLNPDDLNAIIEDYLVNNFDGDYDKAINHVFDDLFQVMVETYDNPYYETYKVKKSTPKKPEYGLFKSIVAFVKDYKKNALMILLGVVGVIFVISLLVLLTVGTPSRSSRSKKYR